MIITLLVGLGTTAMPAASPATIDSNHRRATAEPPYIHQGIASRYVYGAANHEAIGETHHVFVWLYQWPRGAWHNVAHNEARGTKYNLRTISLMNCPPPFKSTYFYTYSSAWTYVKERNQWYYDGSDASRAVELEC
ncbi:hypothetical protein [Arthrobacter mobilis]|uniref:Uncharacterized protein n=1 Tax=Arthrobacter mobilis TaxID=2724944 RepID=A0A7X6K5C3_9MICC|nr:hypothetical protein [Arthrobacter mobilis]NKX56287.1 hypothetical protein [Arthrobacter mobilis]